jgi:tetratricopeptide (TPR) repeat protein
LPAAQIRKNKRRTKGVAPAAALVLVLAGSTLALQPQEKPAPPAREKTAAAIRLNNLGVAYMNQQRFEQALENFEQAAALDSGLGAARLNRGIALLNLQRLDAARAALEKTGGEQPKNPRAWYNLGLLYRNAGEAEKALEAFGRAAALDAEDADTQYFLGASYAQLQQYAPAIAAFERALALNAFHVSAEFGLARAYQRAGDAEKARTHVARFQRLTQEKLGAPMSLAYGDQGKYSLAEEVRLPAGSAAPAIPVKFVPVQANEMGIGVGIDTDAMLGACVGDFDNDGWQDIFLPSGSLLHNRRGRFEAALQNVELDERHFGCRTGDYDNDGWPDIVVFGDLASTELLRNTGKGTFTNVTASAGISTDKYACDVVFLDFDHDGDLDLYVVRELKSSDLGNALWRNNGNGTFTDWTEPTGLRGSVFNSAAVAADFNGDRAIDIVLANDGGMPGLFVNRREGAFKRLPVWEARKAESALGMAVLDFDRDGWPDLIFRHFGSPDVTLWRNIAGKKFTRVTISNPKWIPPFEDPVVRL